MDRPAKKNRGVCRFLPLAALAAGLLWAGNFTVGLTQVRICSKKLPAAFEGFRIALVTDLHNRVFGPDNDWLIGQLEKAEPDLIALSGDIADEDSDLEVLSALLPRLTAIAPCVYVTGNHEWRMKNRAEWFSLLEKSGVTYLPNRFARLTRDGSEIILAGVDDPNGPRDQKTPGKLLREVKTAAPDDYIVVLCHRNDQLENLANLGADLVLSGHAHGGVVRLPFFGALFGTHYEFFPEDTQGVISCGEACMVVSRGLGGSRRLPVRIANRPEIPVITLHSEQ